MNEITSQIADRIRGAAAEKRFSQRLIAETLKLSRASVSERMNGRISFSGAEIQLLSVAMGVPVSRFFPETPA